ncbi:hypothetical protein ACHAPQ_006033, partial [Fusarium lateritium]
MGQEKNQNEACIGKLLFSARVGPPVRIHESQQRNGTTFTLLLVGLALEIPVTYLSFVSEQLLLSSNINSASITLK